jgi:hypothetical protein
MTVTDIADEVQSQIISAVEIVQENVVTALGWVSDQAETRLPEQIARFAERLPQATEYVDRGFDNAEAWLRNQRDFATKVAGAVQRTPQAPTA